MTQCIAPGSNGALETLSISGPRVYGADNATTVYWRPVSRRVGATQVELAPSVWRSAPATTTRAAVFGYDGFDFFGSAYWQQWQAGVEVYRYSPTRGWEYASAGYLPIKHTITAPFPSTFYSTAC